MACMQDTFTLYKKHDLLAQLIAIWNGLLKFKWWLIQLDRQMVKSRQKRRWSLARESMIILEIFVSYLDQLPRPLLVIVYSLKNRRNFLPKETAKFGGRWENGFTDPVGEYIGIEHLAWGIHNQMRETHEWPEWPEMLQLNSWQKFTVG